MANTIPALKRNFLSSQVRVLNAPLEPAEDWRETGPAPEGGKLSEGVVEDVLKKVNKAIRSHNAAVFPSQALSHVAQQIDALYWAAAAPDVEGHELPPDAISVDADLRDDAVINSLPETFPDQTSSTSPENTPRPSKRPRPSVLESFDTETRYARLRNRLRELTAQRAESQQKLEETRATAELLRPLRDARENIQPNLDSSKELEAEVERMKVLAARLVAGLRAKGGKGAGARRDRGDGGMEMDRETKGGNEKLDALMDVG